MTANTRLRDPATDGSLAPSCFVPLYPNRTLTHTTNILDVFVSCSIIDAKGRL
jgi:hypothetical protein